LLTIINDILDFSKIEAGRLELERIPLDLARTLTSVIAGLQAQAAAKGLAVVLDLDKDLPAVIIGDPVRLGQVITNLLGNAIKFTEQGSIRIAVRGLETLPAGSVRLQVSVTDSGIGIAPEKLASIFEAFVQSDSSVTRQFGGTGLGLAISNRLVGQMGGHLRVQSVLGQGSTFLFDFVAEVSERAAMGDTDHALAEASPTASPLNILLVEDNKVNQRLTVAFLSRAGHRVTVANNGFEALDLLTEHTFDVALMDLQMPGLDGLQTTQIIRERESVAGTYLPIIALTANALVGDRERCLAAGMDAYLAKPFNRAELIGTVDQLVSRLETPETGRMPAVIPPAPVTAEEST
jgi:CheY-like chemotaxis protein